MIASLLHRLFPAKPKTPTKAEEHIRAVAAFRLAKAVYDDAARREDKRGMGERLPALQRARHQLMRIEASRSQPVSTPKSAAGQAVRSGVGR